MFINNIIFLIFIEIIFIIFFYYLFNLLKKKINRFSNFKEIGGISIYFTLIFSLYIFDFDFFYQLLIYSSAIIVFIGFLDDFLNLNAFIRSFFQIFIILFVISFNYKITNTGYFDFNNYHILFSIIFTVFCILLLINGLNFLDGIDGAAGLNIITSILIMIFYIFLHDHQLENTFLIVLIFLISVFLFFNFRFINFFNKIYLGDAGSNMFGYILAWLIIYFSSPEINLFPSALAIWVISYPMFDMLSIIIKRVSAKKNPMKKDFNHNHHKLMSLGFSIFQVNFIIIIISIGLAIFGYFIFTYLGALYSIISYLISFLIYFYFFYKYI